MQVLLKLKIHSQTELLIRELKLNKLRKTKQKVEKEKVSPLQQEGLVLKLIFLNLLRRAKINTIHL